MDTSGALGQMGSPLAIRAYQQYAAQAQQSGQTPLPFPQWLQQQGAGPQAATASQPVSAQPNIAQQQQALIQLLAQRAQGQ